MYFVNFVFLSLNAVFKPYPCCWRYSYLIILSVMSSFFFWKHWVATFYVSNASAVLWWFFFFFYGQRCMGFLRMESVPWEFHYIALSKLRKMHILTLMFFIMVSKTMCTWLVATIVHCKSQLPWTNPSGMANLGCQIGNLNRRFASIILAGGPVYREFSWLLTMCGVPAHLEQRHPLAGELGLYKKGNWAIQLP